MMIVVSDTSPISNLLRIGKIELLRDLFGSVVVPPAVYEEISRIEEYRLSLTKLGWIQTVELTETDLRNRLLIRLDLGEAEAIALAVQLRADYVLIDEIKGRRAARELHIPITGLLGVLLQAKERGLIDAVGPLIERLINEARFWLDPILVDEILQRVGEK